jgi:hypothetical protein
MGRLSVFKPYKSKKGSKDTILYNFTQFVLSPWHKKIAHSLTKKTKKLLLFPKKFIPPYRELWMQHTIVHY